jgi:hypothetical protein
MSPGAKLFLTIAGIGGAIGAVLLVSTSKAHAKPRAQVPGDNSPPDVIVPPVLPDPSSPSSPSSPLPLPPLPLPPLPGAQAPSTPSTPSTVPPGVTYSLPNPLGGAPIGTFDPATGNVFGPGGFIVGTFDPATGIFTSSTGQQIQIPGFGQSPAAQVPSVPAGPVPPLPDPSATLPPRIVDPDPTPDPVPPVLPAQPATTVSHETAAMVSALLDAEGRPGWNKIDPSVLVFQKARPPLKQDSKFGPQTALTAALEIGTLPLIRFWPLGSTKAKLLASYKAALLELANKSDNPLRAEQLRQSAAREDARAFSTKGGLPAVAASQRVALARVA